MYCIGDKVVHPMHGAGIIKDMKRISIAGIERDYYVVCFAVGSMISDIPVEGCEKIGIRGVISKDEAKKVLDFFHNFKIGNDINWNKRQRENMAKLKSGDIYQVTGVLKELMCREKRKGLSTSERKTLCSARQIVLSELILSEVAGESDIQMILDDTVSEAIG
ncbi:MAG: CarD family transcriptional regulator [Clostridiales bacterium]|nr:CarD family transcriptional regulator [Clostridiales bacterium]